MPVSAEVLPMVHATAPNWLRPYPDDDATPFDRLVEGWNRLVPEEREEAIRACRREGHAPRLDVGFALVCVRCLHYADA